MSDYQERVLSEQKELIDKLEKLDVFMNSETFSTLSAIDQSLLMVQHSAMENYSDTLDRRIERF
jgi:hypothetical protein